MSDFPAQVPRISLPATGISELALPTVVLLVFYLYLLVRWERVRRPSMFLIGALALTAGFVGRFFAIGHNTKLQIVLQVLDCIAAIGAFACAVAACCGAALPGLDKQQGVSAGPAPGVGPEPPQ